MMFYLAGSSTAQILDNSKGTLFTNESFFSEKFIQANKIKAIKGALSSKKELKGIVDRGLFKSYHFKKNGRLQLELKTYFKGSAKDTAAVEYVYNEKEYLVAKHETDENGYFSYRMDVDNDGNVIHRSYLREKSSSRSKEHFTEAERHPISEEFYEYKQISKLERKKIFINNEKLPYKEETTYYNSLGYKTEVASRYIVTNKRSSTKYEYDDYGRLGAKIEESSLFGKSVKRFEYDYDQVGNILEHRYYKNGTHKTTTEFMYDGETMFLKAMLTREEDSKTIHITKYTYDLY